MKRILGLTTAALMSASVLAAPAFAEQNEILPGAETGTSTDLNLGVDIDQETTAAIGATPESALSAISGSATAAGSIETMTEVSAVNVVRISDFEQTDASAVQEAATANQAGVDELRAAIEANAALSQELEAQGVETSSVVAAEIGASGEVTVFVM